MGKDKKINVKPRYKARRPKKFAAMYTGIVPCYKELCKGESVELNLQDEQVRTWLVNKIIIKE